MMGGKRIGTYSQREIVPVLIELVHAARAKGASAHRDIARAKLRVLLREEHWNTPFVLHNTGPSINRYIAGLGYPVSFRFLSRADSFAKYAKPVAKGDEEE